jgi:xanthine dehydrogenase YagS FAD-binding subunit
MHDPPELEHYDASSLAEASSLLWMNPGKSMVIAGGTDIIGALREEIFLTAPKILINLKTIPGLDFIQMSGGVLRIGAMTRISDIEKDVTVASNFPALAKAAHMVAHPEIRNMGTIGGNLCQETRCWYYRGRGNKFYCKRKGGATCNLETGMNQYGSIFGGPAGCFASMTSDIGTALLALDATVITNRRSKPIDTVYTTAISGTTLRLGEIVTEVQVPVPPAGNKQAYLKFRLRKSIDPAIVSVASLITANEARIALGAVAPKPLRATQAENVVKAGGTADAAATAAVAGALPLSKNAYKVQITKALVKRAILA